MAIDGLQPLQRDIELIGVNATILQHGWRSFWLCRTGWRHPNWIISHARSHTTFWWQPTSNCFRQPLLCLMFNVQSPPTFSCHRGTPRDFWCLCHHPDCYNPDLPAAAGPRSRGECAPAHRCGEHENRSLQNHRPRSVAAWLCPCCPPSAPTPAAPHQPSAATLPTLPAKAKNKEAVMADFLEWIPTVRPERVGEGAHGLHLRGPAILKVSLNVLQLGWGDGAVQVTE